MHHHSPTLSLFYFYILSLTEMVDQEEKKKKKRQIPERVFPPFMMEIAFGCPLVMVTPKSANVLVKTQL